MHKCYTHRMYIILSVSLVIAYEAFKSILLVFIFIVFKTFWSALVCPGPKLNQCTYVRTFFSVRVAKRVDGVGVLRGGVPIAEGGRRGTWNQFFALLPAVAVFDDHVGADGTVPAPLGNHSSCKQNGKLRSRRPARIQQK
jgi:hypothetical protein